MAIQIRRGTNTEWESNNSNIVVGEPAIATDAERFFVGTASGDYAEFANLDIIAPAHDTSTSYVVGDVINRQGKLYSCNTPCSGAFNVSYWDEKSLAEILKDLENEIDYAQYEIGYASGELITIDNGASEIPVKDLTLDIEAVQSGSGDPSPTNVRPISGWDEVNVNVSGINVWDEEWEVGGYNASGVKTGATDRIRTKNMVSVLPSTSYCIRGNTGGGALFFYNSSGTFLSSISATWSNAGGRVFTTPSTCYYLTFMSYSNYGAVYNNDISINYPSTDTGYHAYNGQTYTIDLDGTRYGGSLDVTTGVLTVTHGVVDLGSKTWTYSSGKFRTSSPTDSKGQTAGGIDAICSCYKKTTLTTGASGTFYMNNSNYSSTNYIAIFDSNYTDATAFKNSLSGQTIVYPLATPQVVQLTPTQVRTVLGTNNLWNQMNSNNELAYRISNALN